MNIRLSLVCIPFLAASLAHASSLACAVNGAVVELCGGPGFEITVDLSGSGVSVEEIGAWASRQYTLPGQSLNLFHQSVSFSNLKAAEGTGVSMGWGVSMPAGVLGALGYRLDGQIGVLGLLTGAPSTIKGAVHLSPSAAGTHSFEIGVIYGTATTVSVGELIAEAPANWFSSQTFVDPVDAPEPSTLALTFGLLAAMAARRRR